MLLGQGRTNFFFSIPEEFKITELVIKSHKLKFRLKLWNCFGINSAKDSFSKLHSLVHRVITAAEHNMCRSSLNLSTKLWNYLRDVIQSRSHKCNWFLVTTWSLPTSRSLWFWITYNCIQIFIVIYVTALTLVEIIVFL